jgi:predicted nucleic acid-binding protein
MLRLVDTSCWIELLRPNGRPDIKRRLGELLLAKEAAWCDVVLLELWNGANAEKDAAAIIELEKYVIDFEIDDAVWRRSHDLARRARAKGWSFPVPDLLIAACAAHHGVSVESRDAHLEKLEGLG